MLDKRILSFLRSLRRHNDRVWFNEHKEKYQEVKVAVESLTSRLIAGISEFDPDAAGLRPADCLYRIYRDTRFSPDKTPYKTHIGIYINPPYGKKSPRCGYYLHLEPDDVLVAGGAWCPESQILKAIRQDIFDNVDEYLEIIRSPEYTREFPVPGLDLLKTAPKGFPKDWEHIDLLRPRDFSAMSSISDSDLSSPDFEDIVLRKMKAIKPLNDFFNYTIDSLTSPSE
ncbi:MAG: DUF2461 domain-containing protein [Muribaculaceae bacterium]|nr:DUF2461 domain-containing protein [Muribaculaceae bacterium]